MGNTFDDPTTYLLLMNVCVRFGLTPSSSIQTEAYFRQLLLEFETLNEAPPLETWLSTELPRRFPALGFRPQWLQGSEWPVVDGRPMVFVGQIDLSISENPSVGEWFHDDTSVYVFIGRKVPPICVLQQM